MKRRTRSELRKIVIDYIITNKEATVSEIQDNLNVNIHRTFGGIKNAFKKANTEYPIRNSHDHRTAKRLVTDALKNNPTASVEHIQKTLGISFYKHFKNSNEAYKEAKITFISKSLKRRLKKQENIIEYIKMHSNATQWEINKKCNTHVQEIFKGGIREAFKKAGIKYPIERLNIYGSAKKKIKNRALNFESKILNNLKAMGAETHVRTTCGIADAVIQLNGKKYVIEIKDYKTKPISLSEIKQINRYINDLKCKNGIIICSGNRKIDKVKFDSNEILIIPESYLSKLNGVMVQPGTIF